MSDSLYSSRTRIALDAMGGDYAPQHEIEGAVSALRYFKQENLDVEIVLYGDQNKIQDYLKKNNHNDIPFTIVHCNDVISMNDDPTAVARTRKESSLYRGIEDHKSLQVHGFVSTGNTGAVMSTATLLLGRIPGVSRPTIGTFLPTAKEHKTVLLLDAGANSEVKPKYLHEFAVMGSVYSKISRNIDKPSIGLLNVGEEETKGTEIVRQALDLMKNDSSLNFHGNVEGRDIMAGEIDIVVCDGFVGNIILKFAESILGVLRSKIRNFAKKNIVNTLLAGMIAPILRKILKDMDYQQYGGVPLLGVNGVVIIGHGKSTPLAIKNMILVAEKMIRQDLRGSIEHALKVTK